MIYLSKPFTLASFYPETVTYTLPSVIALVIFGFFGAAYDRSPNQTIVRLPLCKQE